MRKREKTGEQDERREEPAQLPGWVAKLVRAIIPIHQGSGFDPQTEYIQESTNNQ